MKPNSLDEQLESAGANLKARPSLRQRAQHAARIRRMKVSSASAACLVMISVGAVAMWPRPSVAEEAFGQMVARLNTTKTLHCDFYRSVDGAPETKVSESAYKDGVWVTHAFLNTDLEMYWDLKDGRGRGYWPKPNYILIPQDQIADLPRDAAVYDAIKYLYIDNVGVIKDEKGGRKPASIKPGPKMKGRDTFVLEFYDAELGEEWRWTFTIDAQTKLPLELVNSWGGGAGGRATRDRMVFAYGESVDHLMRAIPNSAHTVDASAEIKKLRAEAQGRKGIFKADWVSDGTICIAWVGPLEETLQAGDTTLLRTESVHFLDEQTGAAAAYVTADENAPESLTLNGITIRRGQSSQWPDWMLLYHGSLPIKTRYEAAQRRSRYWQKQGDHAKALHYARRALDEAKRGRFFTRLAQENLELIESSPAGSAPRS